LQHSQDEGTEVIIADNGSKDNSVQFLKEKYPGLRTIIFDKNYGFTGGYNKALAQVDAKYYLLLNSDIEVTENWLKPLHDIMENNPDIAVCSPKIKSYRDKDYFEYAGAAGGFIDQYGFPFCRGRILDTVEKDNGQYEEATDIFWATGACMFIKADLYHKAGGLDDDFFAHMEEIDLCWRLKNMGYKISYVPESTIYHVGGGTLPNESPFKLYLNYRNNLYLLYKNLPGKNLYPIVISRLLLDIMSSIIFLLKGKFNFVKSIFQAHWTFFTKLRTLRQKRRKIDTTQLKLHAELYKGSIIFDYFIKKKHKFTDLEFKK
jgi:GT2 family glycosyltransferase